MKEFLKELKFDSKTYKRECWDKRICAICGNKADFGKEIRLNMHCKKCYKNYYLRIEKENIRKPEDCRKLYKELLEQNE